MFCTNCGSRVEERQLHCTRCGKQVSRIPFPSPRKSASRESQPSGAGYSGTPTPVHVSAGGTVSRSAARNRHFMAAAIAVLAIAALLAGGTIAYALNMGSTDVRHASSVTQPVKAKSPEKEASTVSHNAVNDYSWDELATISDAIAVADSDKAALQIAKDFNLVGPSGKLDGTQAKDVRLSDGSFARAYIIGFRHDNRSGGGRTGITFMLEDCIGEYHLNGNGSTGGGWRDSDLRWWMNDTLVHDLPSDLQNSLVYVNKFTNNDGKAYDLSAVTTSCDLLWAPSFTELVGHVDMDSYERGYDQIPPSRRSEFQTYFDIWNAEGSQYKLFSDQGVRMAKANDILVKRSPSGATCAWWGRSASPGEWDKAQSVSKKGEVRKSTVSPADWLGVAPCFSIGHYDGGVEQDGVSYTTITNNYNPRYCPVEVHYEQVYEDNSSKINVTYVDNSTNVTNNTSNSTYVDNSVNINNEADTDVMTDVVFNYINGDDNPTGGENADDKPADQGDANEDTPDEASGEQGSDDWGEQRSFDWPFWNDDNGENDDVDDVNDDTSESDERSGEQIGFDDNVRRLEPDDLDLDSDERDDEVEGGFDHRSFLPDEDDDEGHFDYRNFLPDEDDDEDCIDQRNFFPDENDEDESGQPDSVKSSDEGEKPGREGKRDVRGIENREKLAAQHSDSHEGEGAQPEKAGDTVSLTGKVEVRAYRDANGSECKACLLVLSQPIEVSDPANGKASSQLVAIGDAMSEYEGRTVTLSMALAVSPEAPGDAAPTRIHSTGNECIV